MGSVRKRNFTFMMLNSVLLGILLGLTGLYAIETPEVYVQLGHTGPVMSIALSPDGRYLVSGGWDNTIKLWELSSGRELRTFTGHTRSVMSVALSPDGRYLVSGSEDKTIKLWELSSGREVRTFTGHTFSVSSVALSPDGRSLVSGSYDGTIKLWELSSGRELRTFTGHTHVVTSVALSPDGRSLVSGSSDKTINLWELSSGRHVRTFTGHTHWVNSVALSPDGRYLVSGSWDKTIKLWELSSGRELRTFTGHTDMVSSVALSPDGRYLFSESADKTIKLWELSSGRQVRTFTGHADGVNSVALSTDGRYLVSWTGYGTFKLLELPSGRELFTGDTYSVGSVALSPDGRYLVSAGWDGFFKLWELSSGRVLRTFTGHTDMVNSVALSPDGRYLVSGSDDNTIKLWELPSGREVHTFTGHTNAVSSVALSPDGRYLVSGSWDNTIKLWELSSGRELRTFTGHTAPVSSVALSPDGRFLVSGSYDGTVRLWDVSTGKELVQMVSFTNGEWIALTPKGYYTASAGGDSHLLVRMGTQVYSIDQYRSTLYRPDVVEAVLQGRDIAEVLASAGGTSKVTPTSTSVFQAMEPPFLVIKSPEEGQRIQGAQVDLSVYVEDRNYPIRQVRVFVNGRSEGQQGERGIEVVGVEGQKKRVLELKVPITLDPGDNLIEVVAFNGFSETRKQVRCYVEEGAASQRKEDLLPNLWILSIGVNQYQDRNLRSLSYAVADAEAMVAAFQTQKGKLFREVRSLLLTDRSTVKPTYENILDNLSYLSKASAKDVVLLFLAGHGVNDERGDFYFLPADAVILEDGSFRKSRAIPWREFKALLDLPAKKLIFADTCHSEGLGGNKTRGVDNDRFVRDLQEAHAVIFTSSRGKQLSQESDKWGHGVFTYAILEGLRGKADLIKDGKISMKELDTYVSETVPQLTNGAQHPITHTPEGYLNFPLAVVDFMQR